MKRKFATAVLLLSVALLGACNGEGSEQAADTDAAAREIAEEGTEILPEAAVENAGAAVSSGETETQTQAGPAEAVFPKIRSEQVKEGLPDGTYSAEFHTDSSMFHVSEACDGRGTLTVKDGEMTIHISLGSKKILNLYPGPAGEAAKDTAGLLQPTEDTVTYSDGMTEEVYGFDVPVPALGTEFDLALIGTKEKWYDHKVSVSDPVLLENETQTDSGISLADGKYTVGITFGGGSGRAQILSPAEITVRDGKVIATVQWDSPNYDYMLVNGDKYLPVNTGGNSVFEIPVLSFDEPVEIIGDTVAMSRPHEIEYTLTFHSGTIKEE